MNTRNIAKEEFLKRFEASKKRKKELVETLRQELQKEHIASTGYSATNIFVM